MPSAQILVLNALCQGKDPGLLGEMADSRGVAGNTEDEPGSTL